MNDRTTKDSAQNDPTYWADRSLWNVKPFRHTVIGMGMVCLALVLFLLWKQIKYVIAPITIALILVYMFDPLLRFTAEKLYFPRALSLLILLILFLSVLIAVMVWLIPNLAEQFRGLYESFKRFVEQPPGWFTEFLARLRVDFKRFSEGDLLENVLVKDIKSLTQTMVSGGSETVALISRFIGKTTYWLFSIVLIPIYFFFFGRSFQNLHGIKQYIPESHREEALEILKKMDHAVSGFFRGRLAVALIMGVLFSVGWKIAGVPYALLIGIVSGLLSIIPYAAALGWLMAVFIVLIVNDGYSFWRVFFWPTAVYGAVQLLEGWVLTPWIQSKASHMSAVTVIIVVLIGGTLSGIYGMILAIPVAACLKILFQEIFLPGLRKWAARH